MPSAGSPRTRIIRLTESDWEQFAHLRLRALSDAFGAADEQYLTESRFTTASWQQRLRDHAQFALFVTGGAGPATFGTARPAGLIAAHRESADTVYLYSLWLDPRVRGRGLARGLVGAALDWARRSGVRTVTLRMAPNNRAARAVYEGFGFTEVPGGGADEVGMRLSFG
ncbi:MAG TPA: GNAT family N-acetyltransferase [Mycobacterium sp.]|nr:GNAT family N-acetyltransferase [Mycobacterium sp.]